MSDLISRSDVLELQRYSFGVSMLNSEEYIKVSDVDNILTAYDIDRVVEELDKSSDYYECEEQGREHVQMVDLTDAIEIVKQGSVSDDVCEWKDKELYGYYTSCTEFRSCIACKDKYWKYCPYCGKKIKAVE